MNEFALQIISISLGKKTDLFWHSLSVRYNLLLLSFKKPCQKIMLKEELYP